MSESQFDEQRLLGLAARITLLEQQVALLTAKLAAAERTTSDDGEPAAKRATVECQICGANFSGENLKKHWTTAKHRVAVQTTAFYCGLDCTRRLHRPWLKQPPASITTNSVNTIEIGAGIGMCIICGGRQRIVSSPHPAPLQAEPTPPFVGESVFPAGSDAELDEWLDKL